MVYVGSNGPDVMDGICRIEWAGCHGWYMLDRMERMLWMVYVGSNGPDVMDGLCDRMGRMLWMVYVGSNGTDVMDGLCRIEWTGCYGWYM